MIITQFLIEAALLTFSGGAIGITLGIALSYILASYLSLPFVLSLPSILLAFGVSALTGIIFGFYPAQKAAGLEPVEALRYE